MTDRELMQQALDSMTLAFDGVNYTEFAPKLSEVIKALRARLAQPEPVSNPYKLERVVFYRCDGCQHQYFEQPVSQCDCLSDAGFTRLEYYTAPPQPSWQVIPDGVSAKQLTEMKAKNIIDRDGFVVGGYILDRETEVCLVHHSAVRWMKYDELFQILRVTNSPQREWQQIQDEEADQYWDESIGTGCRASFGLGVDYANRVLWEKNI